MHWCRKRVHGTPGEAAPRRRPNGAGTINYGYIYVRRGKRRMMEHRFVKETELGREITRAENVHHDNECRTDNRPDNLEVMTRGEHTALHWQRRRHKK